MRRSAASTPTRHPACDRRTTATSKVPGQRTRKDGLDSLLRLTWLAAIREWGRSGMEPQPPRLLPYCCQAGGQRLTRAEHSGMSAQSAASDGRSWTMCPLLQMLPADRSSVAVRAGGQQRRVKRSPGNHSHCRAASALRSLALPAVRGQLAIELLAASPSFSRSGG